MLQGKVLRKPIQGHSTSAIRDAVIDNDVLVNAWKAARRGSTLPQDVTALNLLSDQSFQWVVTPTHFKEFIRQVPHGRGSRLRFLRSLSHVEILSGPRAAGLRSGARFNQVFNGLRSIANQSAPGLGNRSGVIGSRRAKSHFNDIVNQAFAEELRIPFVTGDKAFIHFLNNHARNIPVNGHHFFNFP